MIVLQNIARLRRKEAPIVAAQEALRRTDSAILEAQSVVKAAMEREKFLTEERERDAARLEAAEKALEDFFAGHSPEWRERLLAEATRADRDALPTAPLEKARAHFPPRADGGKDFTINKVTGERERVR